MHSALLIDEILRLIFRFCMDHGDRRSLVCAARTCKAWKEPALDFVWYQLSSPEPLLRLLFTANNTQTYTNRPTLDNPLTFHSYARRVKHLNNRQDTRINLDPTALILLSPSYNIALPNLITAQISIPRYNTLSLPFILSPRLVQLDVDLGFKARASDIDKALCSYLESAVLDCSTLCHVSLRGFASRDLNNVISSMRLIRSLSLRLGQSLLPETLRMILTFPMLEELEIHAGHIKIHDIYQVFANADLTYLALLNKLYIRAKSSLIAKVLVFIQPNTLHHLHIELDDPSPNDSNWTTIFDRICSKASSTLRHLALEHHFEIPEPNVSSSPDATSASLQPTTPSPMPFETLQILDNLKLLRHFSCDLTLPAAISDKHVEKLVTWWPDLEHLEFGSAPHAEDQRMGVAQITTASLAFFAAKCFKLRKLILPLVIEDPPPSAIARSPASNQLCNLAIAQLKTSDPLKMAEYLHTLFPTLQDLEGPFDDSQPWTTTKKALVEIRSS